MVFFIDNTTRYIDKYILQYLSESLGKLNKRMALGEEESGKEVKRCHTAGGGQYTSKMYAEYHKSEGILNEMTTPYTLQSNGVVQQVKHMMMEAVRCIFADAPVWKKSWVFVVLVTMYFKNRTSTHLVVGNSPYKAWHERNYFGSISVGLDTWLL